MKNKTNIKIILPLLAILTSSQGATFEPFPMAPQIEFGNEVPYYGEKSTTTEEWTNPFGVNAFDIRGNISTLGELGANDTIVIKVYNSLTGEVVYSSVPNEIGNYKVYIPEVTSGSIIYNVKIETFINGVNQDYFVDFGTQDDEFAISYKEAEQIQWLKNSSGVDIAQDLNGLALTVNTPNNFISYNLADVDNNKFVVNGKIKVSETFTPGTIKIVAINTSNAKEYAFYTKTTPMVDEENTYEFEMKLLKDHNDYIIKIVTQDDKTLELNEMYYNYGSDRMESSDDQIVGMQNVEWVETSEGSNQWIPDLAKTSYLHIDDSFSLYSTIDSTMFGKTDYKISGTITTRSDSGTKGYSSDGIVVSIFDAMNGKLLDSSVSICNDDFTSCSYDLNIGSILNNINDSENGGYIFKVDERVNYVTKNFYYDYGSDHLANSSDDSLKAAEKINIDNGVPVVNYLQISELETLANINMDSFIAPNEYEISGKFTDVDPLTTSISITYIESKLGIYQYGTTTKNDDGTYSFSKPDLEEGVYSVEIRQIKTYENGLIERHEYILHDEDGDGDYTSGIELKLKSDVGYSAFDINGVNLDDKKYSASFDSSTIAYYTPAVKLVELNRDTTIPSLALVPPQLFSYTLNVSNFAKMDGKTVEIELRDANSFNRYNKSLTIDEDTETIVFDNVKEGSYYFILRGDKQEFWLNEGDTQEFIEGVYRVGYQDSEVCWDYKNGIDNCNYDSLIKLVPTLNDKIYVPIEISSDVSHDVIYPANNLFKMTLNLGSDNANKPISVSTKQRTNGYDYNTYSFQTDVSGDVNIELPVKANNNYTVSVWAGYNDYSIKNDNDDFKLVKSSNIYDKSDNYSIYPFGLHTTDTTDLEMGSVELPVLRDVTITFENLEENESGEIVERVLVSLIGGNGYFSSSNIQVNNASKTNTVTFKIPDGDYIVKLSPSQNYSGFVDVDGDGAGDSTINGIDFTSNSKFTWLMSKADTFTVSSDETLNVVLKSLDSYKQLSGTVNLGSGDIEAGWICAKSGTDGKCAIVSSDGTFTINPLAPSGDYIYLVEYRSHDGEMVRQKVTMTDGESISNVNIETIKVTISGTVIDSEDGIKEVVLLEVNNNTNSWTIIKSIAVTDTDSEVEFSFTDMPSALEGSHYEIAVASIVIDERSGVATYTINSSVQADNTAGSANGVTVDDTITLDINQ